MLTAEDDQQVNERPIEGRVPVVEKPVRARPVVEVGLKGEHKRVVGRRRHRESCRLSVVAVVLLISRLLSQDFYRNDVNASHMTSSAQTLNAKEYSLPTVEAVLREL